jgi:hypothetical protein
MKKLLLESRSFFTEGSILRVSLIFLLKKDLVSPSRWTYTAGAVTGTSWSRHRIKAWWRVPLY